MARDHARIFTSIWGDPDFRNLDRDPQRLYLLLLSQPNLTYCGSMDYIPQRLTSLAADEDDTTLQCAMNVLELRRFVVVDYKMSELLLRTFVRHDGLLGSPNITKAMVKARAAILSEKLRETLDEELCKAFQEDPDAKGWEGFERVDRNLFHELTRKGSQKGSPNPSRKGSLRGIGKGESA